LIFDISIDAIAIDLIKLLTLFDDDDDDDDDDVRKSFKLILFILY
jgi:hypothetical protein